MGDIDISPEAVEAQAENLQKTERPFSADMLLALRAALTRTEQERDDIVGEVQRRLQPAGSPPPGDATILVRWIVQQAQATIAAQAEEIAFRKAMAGEMQATLESQAEALARRCPEYERRYDEAVAKANQEPTR